MTYVDYDEYIQSDEWREKRIERLKFADFRCEICNKPSNLHVHHRTYGNLGDEPIEDLIVLCEECHGVFHDRLALYSDPDELTAAREIISELIDEYARACNYLKSRFSEMECEPPPPSGIREMAMVAVLMSSDSVDLPDHMHPEHPTSVLWD